MINTIYLEQQVADDAITKDILQRFPAATVIECDNYGEVFNRRQQNFRLQKQAPALILAKKQGPFVLDAPKQYTIGEGRNFYFSHLLNCIYDCRYCFLQGMYQSAHYVLFVNYGDFKHAIIEQAKRCDEPAYFFSGYDCDSLALEPVSRFAEHMVPLFKDLPNAYLELRTKSTQIRNLLNQPPLSNCIVAFSFTPQPVCDRWEAKVPSVEKRLQAMAQLQQQGWPVGLRFDPLIYHQNYRENYQQLFRLMAKYLELENIHSVTLGLFRLPQDYFRRLEKLYPEESLWSAPMTTQNKMVGYKKDIESEVMDYCQHQLTDYFPSSKLFCYRS